MSQPENENLGSQIGAAMRRLRQQRGLSLAAVARRMNQPAATKTQISHWEQGESVAGEQLLRYLRSLGASFFDLQCELEPAEARNPRLREIVRELDELRR